MEILNIYTERSESFVGFMLLGWGSVAILIILSISAFLSSEKRIGYTLSAVAVVIVSGLIIFISSNEPTILQEVIVNDMNYIVENDLKIIDQRGKIITVTSIE